MTTPDSIAHIWGVISKIKRPQWWELWAKCECFADIVVVVTTPSGEILGRKCDRCERPYTIRWEGLDKE